MCLLFFVFTAVFLIARRAAVAPAATAFVFNNVYNAQNNKQDYQSENNYIYR